MNIIVIGLVAPVGTNKKNIIKELINEFKNRKYKAELIKLTKYLWKNKKPPTTGSPCLDILCKMNISNHLRKTICKSFLACLAVEEIFDYCNNNDDKNVVFILDQIKHKQEHRLLSHLFGLSYIQISIYNDNKEKRMDKIKSSIKKSIVSEKVFKFSDNSIYDSDNCRMVMKKTQLEYITHRNKNEIYKYVIDKDMRETLREYQESNSGQQVDKLFHLSHYFINNNNNCIFSDKKNNKITHVNKFCQLLFGEWKELPTQDEIGMALAYQASFTSNFPGDRKVGACIISKNGEVITVAGIKSPSLESKNKAIDGKYAKKGYMDFKKKIEEWEKILNKNEYLEIVEFLKNSLDFHPSTHAEINAIGNAAKLGVSIRGSTLYSTLYPCHLCAKDIINSGISKAVYIEQYPKSKNEVLYSNIIMFQDKNNKFPLITFEGIGPRRYHYVNDNDIYYESIKNKDNSYPKLLPIFLKYQDFKYDKNKIHDALKMFKLIMNKDDNEFNTYKLNKNKANRDFLKIKDNITKKYNFILDIDLLIDLLDDKRNDSKK